MSLAYFNYRSYIANSWWDRRSFISSWWQIYAGDPFWVPPFYPSFRRALDNPHLARLNPRFVHVEALPKRRETSPTQPGSIGYVMEQPVAAAIALADPRRQDQTAYLALLRVVNDAESLTRLVEAVADSLRVEGYSQIIGPTGLSPHLGSGLLQDYWSEISPLHTPFNPPYLPEVANSLLRARSSSKLYHLEVPEELPERSQSELRLSIDPLDPKRLAEDLLPLFATACPNRLNFAPPDALEAGFLLRWLSVWPLLGYQAQLDEQPIGFILLQPDLAPLLHRAKGAKNPVWRLWLRWTYRRRSRYGRILFAAVLPEWQGKGVGRQLLHHALRVGQAKGWQRLSVGPLPTVAPGSRFLEHIGAEARQTYLLYQWDI